MTKVIYGLNINQFLSEIPDKTEAIKNLGLDIRDLDRIRNIGSSPISLTKEDLKLISGLTDDLRSVLFSLRSTTSFFPTLLSNASVAEFPVNTDITINNQLSASGYKYNYYDFNSSQLKTADISTSRNSSWSSFEQSPTAPIFYSGELEILASGSPAQSLLTTTELEIKKTPELLEFNAQTPTHLVTINVNGTPRQFYAMKGIPLEFVGFFRTATFRSAVTGQPGVLPSLVLEYLDTGQTVVRKNNVPRNNRNGIVLSDFKTRPKKIKFYFNPAGITVLGLPNTFISTWPNVVLPIIDEINIRANDFRQIPNFETLAPNLKTLDISGNDLTRGSTDTANVQLQRLPASIESLAIDGCFSDNTPISLEKFTLLRSFNFNSSYLVNNNSTTRTPGKRMTDAGSTPAVYLNVEDKNTSLREYTINNQAYRKLHVSVTKAENLETYNLGNMNIISDSNDNPIALASLVLRTFSSAGSHNVVNVANRTELTNYQHTYGYSLNGNNQVGGVFTNCNKLQNISFYSTYIEGPIGTSFANLPALQSLDLRLTRIGGIIDNTTFNGSTALKTILIQGTQLGVGNPNPTFSIDSLDSLVNLETIQIINNSNIKGPLPNFNNNKRLRSINIQGTSHSSNLQTYNSLPLLNSLIVRSCALTGSVPKFENNNIETIRLEFNQLSSTATNQFPELNCARLKYFSINNNNLAGPISSFKNCTNLETLIISSNNFSGYTAGSLEFCTRLKLIDFSNCNFRLGDLEQIIADLRKNYEQNKRSGVRINLLGNVSSGTVFPENLSTNITYLRNQGWSVTI